MTKLENLTNASDQIVQMILPDSTLAIIEFVYSGTCERWWANVTYGTKKINGIGLCEFPNILRQWMNIFPFGLKIQTADQTDPAFLTDFTSGRVQVFFLNAADVLAIEKNVFGSAVQV